MLAEEEPNLFGNIAIIEYTDYETDNIANIIDEETKLSKYLSTTVNYDKFKDFIKAKHEINEKTKSFYEKLLYRKINWRTKTYRQKSEDKFLNSIENKFGSPSDIIICIGDWSNYNTIKGLASTMGIGLKRLVSKKFTTIPVKTKVISLQSEKNNLEQAYPGGLIGVGLSIDPSISIADKLVGQMITSLNNSNYSISNKIECEYNITKQLIGSENNDNSKISSIKNNEKLQLSINSSTIKTIIKDKDSRGLPNTPIPPDQVSIAGGFFLSNRDNLTWWHETYYSQLFNYFRNKIR